MSETPSRCRSYTSIDMDIPVSSTPSNRSRRSSIQNKENKFTVQKLGKSMSIGCALTHSTPLRKSRKIEQTVDECDIDLFEMNDESTMVSQQMNDDFKVEMNTPLDSDNTNNNQRTPLMSKCKPRYIHSNVISSPHETSRIVTPIVNRTSTNPFAVGASDDDEEIDLTLTPNESLNLIVDSSSTDLPCTDMSSDAYNLKLPVILIENEHFNVIPEFVGFSTGSGRQVSASKASMKRANTLYGLQNDDVESTDISEYAAITSEGGFKTGLGRKIEISDNSKNRIRDIFGDDYGDDSFDQSIAFDSHYTNFHQTSQTPSKFRPLKINNPAMNSAQSVPSSFVTPKKTTQFTPLFTSASKQPTLYETPRAYRTGLLRQTCNTRQFTTPRKVTHSTPQSTFKPFKIPSTPYATPLHARTQTKIVAKPKKPARECKFNS